MRSAPGSTQEADCMHVLHVSASDGNGGAPRAAYRVHCAIRDASPGNDVRSSMLVARKTTDDPDVHTFERSRAREISSRVAYRIAIQDRHLMRTSNSVMRSTAWMPTPALRRIDALDPDVVLLHWLGSPTLSVAQIGRLAAQRRPVAWRLADTWAFCGSEHYPNLDDDTRFVDGYLTDNRLEGERGLDLNRYTWERKRKHWTRPIQIVAPSHWMARQAKRSALMHDWPVEVIPTPVDAAWWGAIPRDDARKQIQISGSRRIVLFGAIGGESDSRKGADLLRCALPHVASRFMDAPKRSLELLTFGGPRGVERVGDVLVRSVGRLDDDGLRLHYSAADVVVVPSRQDNLPQTAVESIASGTPVVAFSIGGLPDIVKDRVTGRLVEPFRPEALAEGITWVIDDDDRHARLSEAARQSASQWNPRVVAAQYLNLLRRISE